MNDGASRCERCSRPLVAEERFCPTCTTGEVAHFDKATSPTIFDGAMTTMMYRFKFGRRSDYADYFASLLQSEVKSLPPCDVIVPVPTRADKIRERGYDQCDLLGKTLASRIKLPVVGALSRALDARDQVGLSGRERRENVYGTVKLVDGAMIKGKTVLLVDDVLTTGSTVSECARVLKRAGAIAVYAVTVAITPVKVIDNTKGEI